MKLNDELMNDIDDDEIINETTNNKLMKNTKW